MLSDCNSEVLFCRISSRPQCSWDFPLWCNDPPRIQAESSDDDLSTVTSSGESLVPTEHFLERVGDSFDFEPSHVHESDSV